MEDINNIIKEWKDTESEFLRLKERRDELERAIHRIMIDNFWKDYTCDDKTHISLTETEVKDIDWNGLSILLSESDIKHVTRYSVESKLLIVTDDGKNRIRKLIKEGR